MKNMRDVIDAQRHLLAMCRTTLSKGSEGGPLVKNDEIIA